MTATTARSKRRQPPAHESASSSLEIDLETLKIRGLTEGAGDDPRTAVLRRLLSYVDKARRRHPDSIDDASFLRAVGQTLVDEAGQEEARALSPAESSEEEQWLALLEQGMRSKITLLQSGAFKSTAEAAALLGIGEPAVRRRIRERKLFALERPGDGEYRIPLWALDPGIAGEPTARLLAASAELRPWALYDFLSTPSGILHGLKPYEGLLSEGSLPAAAKTARQELLDHRGSPRDASLLEAVLAALDAELDEYRPA